MAATFPSFQWLLDIVLGNATLIVIVGGLAFVIYGYFRLKTRMKVLPIDRADLNRAHQIRRLKNNPVPKNGFKILKRGQHIIMGKITHHADEDIKDNPSESLKTIHRLVIKPLRTPLNIPFGRSEVFYIDSSIMKNKIDEKGKYIEVPENTNFDLTMGIYYNKEHEETNRRALINDGMLRQDLNNLASVYFAKSQQQATFAPDHAHQLAMREKEIQLEMAKRRSGITTV